MGFWGYRLPCAVGFDCAWSTQKEVYYFNFILIFNDGSTPAALQELPSLHQRPSPTGDPAGVIVTPVPGAGAVRS